MITQKELDEMRVYANAFNSRSAFYVRTLLNELERINRLYSEVVEVNDITDGVREKIWPKREER